MNWLKDLLAKIKSWKSPKNGTRPKAKFIGWQMVSKDDPPFPLYNIYGPHRLHHSTVALETLIRENIDIPFTPNCPEWLSQAGADIFIPHKKKRYAAS